jgi:hypothetical protein
MPSKWIDYAIVVSKLPENRLGRRIPAHQILPLQEKYVFGEVVPFAGKCFGTG